MCMCMLVLVPVCVCVCVSVVVYHHVRAYVWNQTCVNVRAWLCVYL